MCVALRWQVINEPQPSPRGWLGMAHVLAGWGVSRREWVTGVPSDVGEDEVQEATVQEQQVSLGWVTFLLPPSWTVEPPLTCSLHNPLLSTA